MKSILTLAMTSDAKRVLDHFCRTFRIRMVIYDAAGKLVLSGSTEHSRYCSLVQKRHGVSPCLENDRLKQDEARKTGRLTVYTCHAGLHEAIIPLYHGTVLIGFALIGQFRTLRRITPALTGKWGRDTRAFTKLFHSLPLIEEEMLDHVLALFSIVVDYIISHGLVRAKGDRIVETIVRFMDDNIRKPISLADAARACERSESYVSHTLRRVFGRSFKEMLIERRITAAEAYARSTPRATVAAMARAAGYDDQFYFSRIYKRVRGYPPVMRKQ